MRRHYTVAVRLIAGDDQSGAIHEAVARALVNSRAFEAGEVDVLVTRGRPITVNSRGFAVAARPLSITKRRRRAAEGSVR